ncbi:2-polyprenyl-6-methoxyphenol hydroxylase [Nonomuraea maritima]|uniref:2-polyprenyl-6-methoxyphenol hydroxylase n=1 Tax=Nonomuraea maritima TaxID=683260 RepID=A0A1G9GJW0_9ACTN|nr:FAD-dependent monooxygenase [Nonomuraea maritima]SDL00957.1 2-polyprenyl-6-methoxyphenol hydroxylase [Nonomuraea maritima]
MRVLVSGAGVGGVTLAHWLRRDGHDVTVVERAPGRRGGGQAVDVRGAALAVASEMGVLDRIKELRTTMRGMSMVDTAGNEIMRNEEATISGGSFDSPDVEIMRDDLTAVLTEVSDATYLYGDSIATLTEDGHVTFESGRQESYDRIVGADGLHSVVRRLTFGDEDQFIHHLGTYVSIFTAPNFVGIDHWQTWFNEGEAGGAVFSDRDRSVMRVNLGFRSDPIAYDHRDVDQQKRLVEERCKAVYEGPRLLEAMWRADDFFFDSMAQVRMENWTKGRVALVGDAGYCASPLSGQGTSLAMVGAYVLAQELGRDPEAAYGRYEERMRPFVTANQALAFENPGQPAAPESIERAANAISLD